MPPLVQVVSRRGARTLVEANAGVLFLPSGPIARWEARLSRAVTAATRRAAPSNKRPRWSHYGQALSSAGNFTTSTKYRDEEIHTVLGARAGYSAFVDQGTGIYAGNAPYEGKILPPWAPGSPTLYEATWRPGPGGKRNGPVMIRGQRGQFFMAEGLRRGLTSMRIPSVEVPDAFVAGKTTAATPAMLSEALGAPAAAAAFRQQLEQWRSWRDSAFGVGRTFSRGGEGGSVSRASRYRRAYRSQARFGGRARALSATERAARDRQLSKKYRDKIRGGPAFSQKPNRVTKPTKARKPASGATASGKARFKAAMLKKYGSIEGAVRIKDGYFYATVPVKGADGRRTFEVRRGKVS